MSDTSTHLAVLNVGENRTVSGILVPFGGAITPGCFARTVDQRSSKVKLLWRTSEGGRPIVLGVNPQISETADGLFGRFQVPETELGDEILKYPAVPFTVLTERLAGGQIKLVDVCLGGPALTADAIRQAAAPPAPLASRHRVSVDVARRRLELWDLEAR
ncbi:hypothetical protein QN239_27445 [Mycolicibacterium sp. Y3]